MINFFGDFLYCINSKLASKLEFNLIVRMHVSFYSCHMLGIIVYGKCNVRNSIFRSMSLFNQVEYFHHIFFSGISHMYLFTKTNIKINGCSFFRGQTEQICYAFLVYKFPLTFGHLGTNCIQKYQLDNFR